MQPASEKCSYLEELSCKEYSREENRFCFNQNQDVLQDSCITQKKILFESHDLGASEDKMNG